MAGVGLPFARLHDLADQEAYGAVLAVLEVRDGLRIGVQHLRDHRQQRAFVAHLLHALFLNDLARVFALHDLFKDDLGLLPADLAPSRPC